MPCNIDGPKIPGRPETPPPNDLPHLLATIQQTTRILNQMADQSEWISQVIRNQMNLHPNDPEVQELGARYMQQNLANQQCMTELARKLTRFLSGIAEKVSALSPTHSTTS